MFISWALRQLAKIVAVLLVIVIWAIPEVYLNSSLENYRPGWWVGNAVGLVWFVVMMFLITKTFSIVEAKFAPAVRAATGGRVVLDGPVEQSPESKINIGVLGFYMVLVFGLVETIARVLGELQTHDWANLRIQGSIWLLVFGFVVLTRKTPKEAFENEVRRAKLARGRRENGNKGVK